MLSMICTLEMFDNKVWLSMSIAALTLPMFLSVFSVFDSLALVTIFVLALECFLLKLWKVNNMGSKIYIQLVNTKPLSTMLGCYVWA